MQEFALTNYDTIYACRALNLKKRLSSDNCFRIIFDCAPQGHTYYRIVLHKTFRHCKNNYCFLTRHQLANFIRQAKQVWNFSFRVIEKENDYVVHLRINAPHIIHKYVCSWIRYAYEFPFNCSLRDAYWLKQSNKQFRYTSIANLFNLVIGQTHYIHYNNMHLIPRASFYSAFMSYKELKERILKHYRLNEVYPTVNLETHLYFPERVKGYNSHDVEYWSEDNFHAFREKKYLRIYDKIKKL